VSGAPETKGGGVHGISARRLLRWIVGRPEAGPFVGAMALAIAFQLLSDGKFLTSEQMSSLTSFAAPVGLVSLGVAVLMISGEFDLSVAQTFALSPIIMGSLVADRGVPVLAAFAIALLVAMGIGAVNGLLVIVGGIPSFIATLGMLFVLTTVSLELAGISPPDLPGLEDRTLSILGGPVAGTPFAAPFVWLLVCGIVLAGILASTPYGNWTRAAGQRRGLAARAMGVPVNRVKMTNFILCAFTAGLAGCLEFANFRRAEVHAGDDYNLLAIVAAVIGGTSLFGVRGTLIGTIIGAVILGALNTGLVLTEVDQIYYTGVVGLILLIAAVVNSRVERAQRGLGVVSYGGEA